MQFLGKTSEAVRFKAQVLSKVLKTTCRMLDAAVHFKTVLRRCDFVPLNSYASQRKVEFRGVIDGQVRPIQKCQRPKSFMIRR